VGVAPPLQQQPKAYAIFGQSDLLCFFFARGDLLVQTVIGKKFPVRYVKDNSFGIF
jgi:hypothetical protein